MPREFGLILADVKQGRDFLVLTVAGDEKNEGCEKYKYSRLELAQKFCQRPISAKDLDIEDIEFYWGYAGDDCDSSGIYDFRDRVSLFLEADLNTGERRSKPDLRIGKWIYLYETDEQWNPRLIIDQEKLQSAIHEVQEMARAKTNGDEAPMVRVTESTGCHGITLSVENIIRFAQWYLNYGDHFLFLFDHLQGILGRNLYLNCPKEEYWGFAGEWKSIEDFQRYYVDEKGYGRDRLSNYLILSNDTECPLYCYNKQSVYHGFYSTHPVLCEDNNDEEE